MKIKNNAKYAKIWHYKTVLGITLDCMFKLRRYKLNIRKNNWYIVQLHESTVNNNYINI